MLKKSRTEVIAVGEMGDYEYDSVGVFADVDGWDLQHMRRVQWYLPTNGPIVLPSTLPRGTFTRVWDSDIHKIAKSVVATGHLVKNAPIPTEAPAEVDMQTIRKALIDHGFRVGAADELATTINRVTLLADWYQREGQDVLEHEIRTFLVIPLLLALGWSEQRLKVEHKRIDIACFDRPYNKNNCKSDLVKCTMLVETKAPRTGLHYVVNQARAYAESYDSCNKLVVTDGIRYNIFLKENGAWPARPYAYLNLADMREHHRYDSSIKGAIEAFTLLLP
ncbi:MAG: type I restriction enzyme HsdR N-terminal domain-containing protein [Firmicutes bacterium]|nr:type I restriction enzyme HsdR N-terminal domain-containing protein [Bacillota bacterium]